MKVILLESVAKVGRKYDIIDVAPGYARNFLMPKSLAEAVTPASAGKIAHLRKQKEKVEQETKGKLEAVLHGKDRIVIAFSGKANEEGHLFASIGKEEIAEKASAAFGVEVTASMVELEKPIKDLGEKEITINAHGQTGTIIVNVEAE